jgi:hypothetical protein
LRVQCPECDEEFTDNNALMSHLFAHVVPASNAAAAAAQCGYCLARHADARELRAHLDTAHPADTKSPGMFTYACLICEVTTLYHFFLLFLAMWGKITFCLQ